MKLKKEKDLASFYIFGYFLELQIEYGFFFSSKKKKIKIYIYIYWGSMDFSFQTQFLQFIWIFSTKIHSKINIFHTLAKKIVK
jgi:hypothetical protein